LLVVFVGEQEAFYRTGRIVNITVFPTNLSPLASSTTSLRPIFLVWSAATGRVPAAVAFGE
jgi:hypothetical protein